MNTSNTSFILGMLDPKPNNWDVDYCSKIIERSNQRISVLSQRIEGVVNGRTAPDAQQITIGSGKRYNLAILFLDICGFSVRPNSTEDEQKSNMRMLNVFMAEMINIVRDYDGDFEKNTGDGLMAYFGSTKAQVEKKVQDAIFAASVMHYVNDHLMTPWFIDNGLPPVQFRVGIDYGAVTIGRVGIAGGNNSMVAIGTSANIASKLMKLIPNGGICIGDDVYQNLPIGWSFGCTRITEKTGFARGSSFLQTPYVAWEVSHRLSHPK